jgi:hypothetical protein
MKKTLLLLVYTFIFGVGFLSAQQTPKKNDPVNTYKSEKNLLIGVEAGSAYRFRTISDFDSPEKIAYQKKLRIGYIFGGHIQFYFDKVHKGGYNYQHGIELRINQFNASASGMYTVDTLGIQHVEDHTKITYMGVAYLVRFILPKGYFVASFGVGNAVYSNKGMVGIRPTSLEGHTYAAYSSLNYNYRIVPRLFVGATLGGLFGYVSNVTIDNKQDKTLEDPENIFHIDLSLGLSYTF